MSVAINRAILLKTRTNPTETVDTGEAYFWLDGQSLKYKDDTQTVQTVATGVTPEDVQDIIGAFITAGSNKVVVTYNDAGNSLTINVAEANIVHQNLSGAGTNTHAQIDSHIANTSNPHATTAAQVGADTAGSAAAAQAFAIQRSNHTGTQTASTISDFTETAQDSAASMITAATHDGVSVAYNDAGNTLAITNTDKGTTARTAHEAALDPHPQYLTSTEGNAAYTPIAHVGSGGTAHANATTSVAGFMSSADKTKLDGVASGATANDTDANLRDRATHTGTQLSTTISDFTEAVQDVIGAAFVDSPSVDVVYNDLGNTITTTLTDTGVTAGTYGASGVPQFTVDAKGRITAASNGPALVIGDNFEEFTDLTTFTTTAATNQVAATFTSTSKVAGKYRIAIHWDWSYSATTSDAIFAVFVDNVQVSQEFRYELSDAATQLLNNHWFYYPTFATTQTHTIELRCRAETAGSTVTVTQVRTEMWRVS